MKEGFSMQEITGTIINLNDFLFNIPTNIKIKYNGKACPIVDLKEGRILSVPDYQREIRWEKETLFALMNDISNGAKFLGNVILSAMNEKDFYIIDGQQRIVSLNMLVNYIKFNYGTEIDDSEELVEIRLNCFEQFKEFQENEYSLSNIDDETLRKKINKSDKMRAIFFI